MHGMSFVFHQLGQCPESILLIKKHEQDGDNLVHAMAVAHLLQESDMAAGTTSEASTIPSLALSPQLLGGLPLMPGHHPRPPFPDEACWVLGTSKVWMSCYEGRWRVADCGLCGPGFCVAVVCGWPQALLWAAYGVLSGCVL